VVFGLTSTEPNVAPPVGKLPVHDNAPEDAHVSSDCSPESIDVGLATSEAVTTLVVSVVVAVVVVIPPFIPAKYFPCRPIVLAFRLPGVFASTPF
jgi:hypothetical protein